MTKKLNKKGTSLVELIAVIVIMGIIAGIAIPTTIAVINRQKKNSALKSCDNILAAAKNVLLEASSDPNSALIATGENAATTGVVKNAAGTQYSVTEVALVTLGELEKKVSTSGTLTITLTTSGTAETGANSFTVACDTLVVNGYTITYDNGFKVAS